MSLAVYLAVNFLPSSISKRRQHDNVKNRIDKSVHNKRILIEFNGNVFQTHKLSRYNLIVLITKTPVIQWEHFVIAKG